MQDFRDKRVLITGGAQGIGLAVGRAFAAEGAEIVLTDLHEEVLTEAAGKIEGGGARVRTYVLDVTDLEAITAIRDRLQQEAGPIDVLVNNAGVVFGGAFLDVRLERHLMTYRINVEGTVAMTHAFLPQLVSRSSAHVVNVASASGLIGLPYGSTYASSKWAVIGFSESLRLELQLLGHRHVGVTAACPSYVATGLFEGAKPPLTTRLLTPDRLAAMIVRAVRHGRRWVLTPWLVKVTPPLKGILPSALFDRISGLLGATSSMQGWRGHG